VKPVLGEPNGFGFNSCKIRKILETCKSQDFQSWRSLSQGGVMFVHFLHEDESGQLECSKAARDLLAVALSPEFHFLLS